MSPEQNSEFKERVFDASVEFRYRKLAYDINLYSPRKGSNTEHSNTSINIREILVLRKWLS